MSFVCRIRHVRVYNKSNREGERERERERGRKSFKELETSFWILVLLHLLKVLTRNSARSIIRKFGQLLLTGTQENKRCDL